VIQNDTRLWGYVGETLCAYQRWKDSVDWLRDWEKHPNVQTWMVTNYVFALHALGRVAQADEVSADLLRKGLRDHSSGYHFLYLALSAIENRHTEEARALFVQCQLADVSPLDRYFQTLVESALSLQEAVQNKKEAARAAYHALKSTRPPTLKVLRLLKAEARALTQMGRDAGSSSLWIRAQFAVLQISTYLARIHSPPRWLTLPRLVLLLLIILQLVRSCMDSPATLRH
jgi:hypothetical protein